jgi:regulator of sigma E protease
MEFLGSIGFDILAMLVTLGILVTFHEYGHFKVARICGVQVERFSIGFGKVLFRWREKRDPRHPEMEPTEYAISALPLGGYVKMLGEQDDVAPAQRHLAFNNKPLHQRAAIVAAGPAANFVLALMLYWLMFMTGVTGLAPVVGRVEADSAAAVAGLQAGDEVVRVDGIDTPTWQEARLRMLDRLGETGSLQLVVSNPASTQQREVNIPIERWLVDSDEPDLLGDLGIIPFHQFIPVRFNEILPEGRAEAAGLQPGDEIVSANGEPVLDWAEWLQVVHDNPEQDIQVGFIRDSLELQTILRPAVRMTEAGTPELDAEGRTQGYTGASVVVPTMPEWMNRSVSYSPWAAIPEAAKETWDNSVFVLESMKKMVIGLISVKNLSGPITIAQVAGDTASIGFEYYISFLAVLSISLGIFNLLPIPVLDGGHLLYYGIEAVIRRPVPRKLQEWGLQLGMLLVVSFMFLAIYNDVNRLF